jgi:hypothetical protein
MCQSPGYGSTQFKAIPYSAWEAILRHQVKAFPSYISDDFIKFQNNFDNIIYDIISTLDLTIGEENICDRSLWSEICRKKDDLFHHA